MEEKRAFDSWKEIAAYLRRSVKTCQRWEAELGLPVHRPDGGKKPHIIAYRDEIDAWRLRSQHLDDKGTPVEPQALRRRRIRRAVAIGLGIALVAGAVASRRILTARSAARPPGIVASLAVLDFENPLDDEQLAGWASALADLLAEDLRQSRFIHVVTTERTLRVLEDLHLARAERYTAEELGRFAERTAVGMIVKGTLLRVGNGCVVTVSVENPYTGEAAGSFSVECVDDKGMIAKVDELTRSIKRMLNLSSRQVARDPDGDTGQIASPSPEAFLLYSQGLREYAAGRYEAARAAMDKAVAVDGEFALAYLQLSRACKKISKRDAAERSLKKALELSSRLSEKRRWLVQAACCEFSDELRDNGLAAYQQLVSADPYDFDGATGLARFYAEAEQWDKAAPLLKKLAAKNKDHAAVQLALAECYAGLGAPDRAEDLLRAYAEAFPENEMAINRASIFYAVIQREFDVALQYAEWALALAPDDPANTLAMAQVHFYQGDLAAAEREFQAYIELTDDGGQMAGRLCLGALCLLEGGSVKPCDKPSWE